MNYDDLVKINKEINSVKYESDETNSGEKDNWVTPKEFMERGSGDCEDYAIAKYFKLKSMGYDPEDMRISHVSLNRGRKKVRDDKGNPTGEYTAAGGDSKSEAHMVLIVGDKVLDNLPDIGVKSISEREDLDIVYQFNEDNLYHNNKPISSADRIKRWADLLARIEEEDMIDDYESGGI